MFGDGSIIHCEGKGSILVRCANGNSLKFLNVLYINCLKVNILRHGKFDDQGCRTILYGGFLIIFDVKGRQITKGKRLKENFISYNLIERLF